MAIPTTIELPEDLLEELRAEAERKGVSVQGVILDRLTGADDRHGGGHRLKGPFLSLKGKPGPRFPTDETPHELILP